MFVYEPFQQCVYGNALPPGFISRTCFDLSRNLCSGSAVSPPSVRRRHETEFYARQASIPLGNNAYRSGNDRSPTLKFSSRFHEGEEVSNVL